MLIGTKDERTKNKLFNRLSIKYINIENIFEIKDIKSQVKKKNEKDEPLCCLYVTTKNRDTKISHFSTRRVYLKCEKRARDLACLDEKEGTKGKRKK